MSNQQGHKDSNVRSNHQEVKNIESKNEKVRVIVKKDGEEIRADSPISDKLKIVIIINNQINKGEKQSSATQIASGSGIDSTGGTNSAIGSSNTKQQHAVGGGGRAINKGENGDQEEK